VHQRDALFAHLIERRAFNALMRVFERIGKRVELPYHSAGAIITVFNQQIFRLTRIEYERVLDYVTRAHRRSAAASLAACSGFGLPRLALSAVLSAAATATFCGYPDARISLIFEAIAAGLALCLSGIRVLLG
jgi:hypothetical protein